MRYTVLKTFIFSAFISVGLLYNTSFAQSNIKDLNASRIENPPKIDGIIDEVEWQSAQIASDFLQYEPYNDRPASLNTEVKILFDNKAIYIAAIMYDSAPDSIFTELGLRDSGDQLNADRFWVDINPFNDGVNGFRFQVTASGIQTDMNMSGYTGNGGDRNWDAVWKSEVKIIENGWIVEMEIPYSALRFPKQNVHQWGINFWREIRRTRETSSWNFVNRRIGNAIASLGVLNGIEDITPPLRLALYPYLSNYVENNQHNTGWKYTINGGIDLKLGISESFTMDMTLIPDFGQVQSDALVLNLSPYEVKYDEKRQFFTEGTELFRKADLFYSRRIGSRPKGYYNAYNELEENEDITENPIETRLINATKISGRTKSGLGIGIFNAMTASSHAIITDTINEIDRAVVTQPFTNYNLIVVDQSLKNNSYLSFINTNVSGSIDGYTANVTGTDFRILDKSNLYRISGNAAVSQQYFENNDNVLGYKYSLSARKIGGTWQYGYYRNVANNTYEQNDMGFLSHNNYISNGVSLSYNIFDPFWRFWNVTNVLSFDNSYLYEPNEYAGTTLGYQLRMLFDTRFFVNFSAYYSPLTQRNFFEPRVPGRFYEIGEAMNLYLYVSSDYRKRVYFDGGINYYKIFTIHNEEHITFDAKPTLRASDKLNLSYRFYYLKKVNNIGYVRHSSDDTIIFGKRNSPTLTNSITANYIFSKDISLSFNLRHYWAKVNYSNDYFLLNFDGSLNSINIEDDFRADDINYNAFTIDMMLVWYFAPGSQLSIVWKNAIYSNSDYIPLSYFDNLNHLIQEPQINSFSIKVLYYLDYQNIKRLFSAK